MFAHPRKTGGGDFGLNRTNLYEIFFCPKSNKGPIGLSRMGLTRINTLAKSNSQIERAPPDAVGITPSSWHIGPHSQPREWWEHPVDPSSKLQVKQGSGECSSRCARQRCAPQNLQACSTRRLITGVSDRALALANRLRNNLVSSDHQPFTQAQTTKRVRVRGATSSGYVNSFLLRLSKNNAVQSGCVMSSRPVTMQWGN